MSAGPLPADVMEWMGMDISVVPLLLEPELAPELSSR